MASGWAEWATVSTPPRRSLTRGCVAWGHQNAFERKLGRKARERQLAERDDGRGAPARRRNTETSNPRRSRERRRHTRLVYSGLDRLTRSRRGRPANPKRDRIVRSRCAAGGGGRHRDVGSDLFVTSQYTDTFDVSFL
ncbi:hypothetical protein GW17_00014649 [Ensete ventricosum]|nr:hypothetical protein GW17_00014649 [Ensete ventricosum]